MYVFIYTPPLIQVELEKDYWEADMLRYQGAENIGLSNIPTIT